MSRRVIQLLPAAHAGDATGEAALHLAATLREAGYDAVVHALTIDDELRDEVQPIEALQPAGDADLTLLHFAIPSPLGAILLRQRGTRGIVYHNLTPPELLAPFAPEVAKLTARGATELRELADSGRIDVAIGVSEFNRRSLEEIGFCSTRVLPLALDLGRYDSSADPLVVADDVRAPTTFLTVGRVAPNKCLEDFLRAASYYLDHIEPNAQFVVVGSSRGLELYRDALAELEAELGLDHRVRWLGRVPHADLVGWYRRAAVYVCTSVHEGFCAPLVEAMYLRVPVLARAAAAIPETLGNAGVTFTDEDPAALAEMMHLLASDAATRERLIASGARRATAFGPAEIEARWLDAIAEITAA